MADETGELYALPLDEFTSARNELEKRLRNDGQRDEAAEVKALRKPTVPAWALNQVARQRPDEVSDLINAGRQVREAQDELLAGGDRKALDSAGSTQRELVRALVRAAVEAGKQGGIATGAAFEEKVGATLRAAAADDEVGSQLVAGRLEREQEAVGLLGFEAGPAAPARAPKKRAEKKKKTTKKGDAGPDRGAAAEKRRTEARERKRLKALETASKAEQRARRAAEAAEQATAKERATAERALERLSKAEADEESARAKLEETVAEVERLDQEGAEP